MIDTVSVVRKLGWAFLCATIFGWCASAFAQEQFKSPDDAVNALVSAAKAEDESAIFSVLGEGGRDITSSGDEVADKTTRENFIAAYDKNHALTPDGEVRRVLVIGDNDWPFPIPLVSKDGTWQFDTKAGREEILRRRIGRNELAAIQVCLAYYDAQYEYAETMPKVDDMAVYAQRVVSRPGKKDGLYWPSVEGQPQSPLGEAVAAASLRGYRVGSGEPYQGYYYKILTRQGPKAPGGAHNFIVDGKMIGGFALIAWPAEYGNSGITTFLINHDGAVYEKDLGEDTTKIASHTTAFNPDDTWKKTVVDTAEKK